MTDSALKLATRLLINGLRFQYFKRRGLPGRPQAISLEITHNCIAKCVMCNIWKIPREVNDLSMDHWIHLLSSDLLSDLKEQDITGGEPFLRDDLPHWCYRPYRLEVDTMEDLNFARALHDHMEAGWKPLKTIIRYLDKNSRLSEINSHVEEKTGTYTSYTTAEILAWQKDYAGRPVVWSDAAGLIGSIDTAKQLTYLCPKCGGALIALHITKGDLELECIKCHHKKKYFSAKPKKK